MGAVIQVRQLSKIYTIYEKPVLRLKDALGFSKARHGREFFALDHIDFTVEKGRTLGIIGENGAGKSTLLKIITGVLSPTDGEVVLDGRVSALLELGTGFNPEYTGIENIYLSGNMMGFSKEEIKQKVPDILDFADIGDFADQKVKTYSSGMFARLAFAVAIHVEPEILIVDEALAVGDLFFQQKCNMYMKEKMSQCTKLLVTHDMTSIANMADEVIVLSKGRLVFYGKPLDAIAFYTKKAHTELFQAQKKELEEKAVSEKVFNKKALKSGWESVSQDSLGGAMDARIESFCVKVNMENYRGYVQSGDLVTVRLQVYAVRSMQNLIIGYQIKDKYGNIIFGENTHSSGFKESSITENTRYEAALSFRWPAIRENDYFLTIGLGEGTHEMQHTIQCWAHNIFEFRNISNLPDHGLFNQKIEQFYIGEAAGKGAGR